jgi:[acyl-carrier-protein] S-malonyltransferase
MIAEHGQADADSDTPEWRLLVAPLAGVFRACSDGQPGVMVSSGDELGHVQIRGGSHLVTPTFPATIIEWLVEDGDPVSAGQPLVRLLPAGTE